MLISKKGFELLTLLTLLLMGFACTNHSTVDGNKGFPVAKMNAITSGTVKSACQLIGEKEIKRILSIPSDANSSIKDVVRTYPTCFYKWEAIKIEEEKIIAGNKFRSNYPAELSLVLVQSANEKMFETSVTTYKDGVDVKGIGEAAIWGDQLSQLTILSNGTMVHIHVKVSTESEDNKMKAIEVAKKIIEKLES